MITPTKKVIMGNSVLFEFVGLSTDTKPTNFEGRVVANASAYLEMDTGDLYLYDAASGSWLKQ